MALTTVKGSVLDLDAAQYTHSNTGSVARSIQSEFDDRISVKNFGATGDGTTDDTTAINNAISNVLSSGRRGDVYFPPGNYRTTATITLEGTGIRLVGDNGELGTKITADHSSGPVVRVKNRRCGVIGIEIDASASRTSGAMGDNYGIWIEAEDTAGFRVTYGEYYNCLIQNQPNVGILVVAACWFSNFEQLTIRDCGSHGMQFDFGSVTSRTNTENPGQVRIERVQIFDCEGNGVIIGNTDNVSNRGFRFDISNLDLFRNAEAAGTRRSADQFWGFFDTSVLTACAFDGNDQAESAATTRGMIIHGRALKIENTRFLNVTPQAIRIADPGFGFTTQSIKVRDIWVLGDNQANLDPLVTLDTGVEGIDIDNDTKSFITATTDATTNVTLNKTVKVVYKVTTETVNNSAALQNDDELFYALIAKERVQFQFNLLFRGNATADIQFAVTVPAGATINYTPANSIRISGGDTLVIQPTIFVSGTSFPVGTDPANTRLISIIGEVRTTGTAGNLQLQWSQDVATVADTEVLAQSHLIVYR